jgi:hypothetical protein
MIIDDSTLSRNERPVTGLDPATLYHWRYRAKLADGWSEWSPEFTFTTAAATAGIVSGHEQSIARSVMPNPVRETATIRFTLPAPSRTTVAIYDALGRTVATLLADDLARGDHNV